MAVDASVVIAAFASWHEANAAARRALQDRPALVAHCAIETYSVLTRLPVPHRAPADLVVEFLRATFRGTPLVLPARAIRDLPGLFAVHGVAGGATYDGLVAATARHHDAVLLTLDARAADTYRRIGVDYRLLSTPPGPQR